MLDAYRKPLKALLLTSLALGIVAACASSPQGTQSPTHVAQAASTPPQPNQMEAVLADAKPRKQLSFTAWLRGFRDEALKAGISPELLQREFNGLRPNPAVLKADGHQPEFTRPIWEYLNSALSHHRISRGRLLLDTHASLLDRIETRYGVDRHILVAIWGVESSYGQVLGNHSIIRALATLGHAGRRPEFARSQLLAALHILQSEDVPSGHLKGSWAGAMGQTQFIPTTYLDYAVDFDGDGHRNLVDSTADALASAAHYLQASHWQTDQRWGFEVRLPKGFNYALSDPSIHHSLSHWRQLGVRGIPTGESEQTQASLLLPAGYQGPAFLVLGNFRSILNYNNSTSYALAIGLLSEKLQGHPGVQASWPTDERPLRRNERLELQRRLQVQGFEPGVADGIIGANTRKAIRAYQLSRQLPADGYANAALLHQLRLSTGSGRY